jgi:hypothetical protein
LQVKVDIAQYRQRSAAGGIILAKVTDLEGHCQLSAEMLLGVLIE